MQSIEGVQAILATTVDPVTENIFYIIEDDFMTLSEFLKKSDDTLSCIFDLDNNGREDEIQELGERVKRILRQIETMRLTFILSSIDQILVRGSNIFLQNPLLTKRLLGIQIHILFVLTNLLFRNSQSKVRLKLILLGDESDCSMNYHHLAAIMKDLLGCCDNNLNSPDDCLPSDEEPPSPRHSVYNLIDQLSN